GLNEGAVHVEHGQHSLLPGLAAECRERRVGLRPGCRGARRRWALARARVGTRHPHDRWKVNVVEVVAPLVQGGIEAEALPLGRGQALPEAEQVPRVEYAVHVNVDAVQLSEVEDPLEPAFFIIELVRPAGGCSAQGKPLDQLLRSGDRPQRQLASGHELTAAREGPPRRTDGRAPAGAGGVLGDVFAAVVVAAAQAQGVPAAGGRVVEAVLARRWRRAGNRKYGVDNEVGRDDVQDSIRQPREVLERRPGEREDDRLRHPEALEPAGERLSQRALAD